MSRNYGWGSRNAYDAVRMELYRQALKGYLSFSSAQTITDRFARFHKFMKNNGVGRLEGVNKVLVVEYGVGLAKDVEAFALVASTAQNLVSAINTIMAIARPLTWESVSPTKDCIIPHRSAVRLKPTLTTEECERGVKHLRTEGHLRAACIAELAYMFGLRSKEASLLDVKKALQESGDYFEGMFNIYKGTKGGRKRKVAVQYVEEREALKRAVTIQNNCCSLMPPKDSWQSWRESGLRKGRDVLHDLEIKGYHEFRAAYAARRYAEIVIDWEAPCNGGKIFDKRVDLKAREIIAEELGHGRIDVVSYYIGGRK